jgi:phosphotriesterase-related protein
MKSKRRSFLKKSLRFTLASSILPELALSGCKNDSSDNYIITVNGKIRGSEIGFTLSHEHVLVDFSGADMYDPEKWNDDDVLPVVIPYIKEITDLGCKTLIECTPVYIGRDPILLRKISDKTGINILTNTGYYGASDNKYIPQSAYAAKTTDLAKLWIGEFEHGINGTGVKPGFMKIGVAPGPLSDFHKKLVTAAGLTHLETGLTIASHTGPALPAFQEIELLQSTGVSPSAFIWVHAQNEKDHSKHIEAAGLGAWVSLDGLNRNNTLQYTEWLVSLKNEELLQQILVSHDAGWYSPGEPEGGSFTPYTSIFKYLIPELKDNGFTVEDIHTLFVNNPAKAFSLKVRKA